MPTLLTSRPRKRKLPPCGRRNEYNVPHSPFQKLIDGQRTKLDLSFRDVASEIGVHAGTFWIWLHNKNGYPHPKSFKPAHLAALARVLKIPQAAIEEAIDASRHLYTPREAPTPQAATDALATLISTLEQVGKRHVTTSWVLNLARRLQAGAVPPAPETPAPPAPRSRSRSLAKAVPASKPAR